ncbi:hypothetical protein OGATHE_002926 [Ogataea polymorpha]|uniref:Uncharacterized protein n=1 Tax=Ogataea polymorpha TaxID=460523 RepID=A0A9P8T8D2_9ASCO|nr:hypothetical protein OGATHE_002926 [Ogataea polymorpha]
MNEDLLAPIDGILHDGTLQRPSSPYTDRNWAATVGPTRAVTFGAILLALRETWFLISVLAASSSRRRSQASDMSFKWCWSR